MQVLQSKNEILTTIRYDYLILVEIEYVFNSKLVVKSWIFFMKLFKPDLPEEKIKAAAELTVDSKHAIVLSGAGISTDSGIPDFRSPRTGLWNQKDAKILTKPGALEENLNFFWKVGIKIAKKILKAKPNKGHKIIAKWENERDIVKAVITQNVDGLHQRAGSNKVIEIHGSADESRCIFCRGYYSLKKVIRLYKQSGKKAPSCIVCGSPIRPNVVLFGDMLPRGAMADATEQIQKADLAFLVGSSSVVYPANYLPVLVKRNGGKLIIINNEPTDLDNIGDIVINASISPVLQEIDKTIDNLERSISD